MAGDGEGALATVSDSGNNYGRVARTGLMDAYTERMLDKELGGIRARDWIRFLKVTHEDDPQAGLEDF